MIRRRVRDVVTGAVGWIDGAIGAGGRGFRPGVTPDEAEAAAAILVEDGRLESIPVIWGARVLAFAENYGSDRSRAAAAAGPVLFEKPLWSVVSEQTPVPVGDLCARGARVWNEGELALVMGREGAIDGVTLVNDITMEMAGFEQQDHHLPFFKGQPAFCPCSGLLLSPAVLDDYLLEEYHDGELMRVGTPRDEIRGHRQLLAWLDGWVRLRPGDLVLLGSPRRVRDRLYARPGTTFRTVLNGEHELVTRFV